MNYNRNEKPNIEHDDMNIRSHLNASLDLKGISVSEDLINRTLQAIQKVSQQQEGNQDTADVKARTKRVAPWTRYVRTFAGVAAAALVLVAGYGLFHMAGGMKKGDMSQLSTEGTAQDSENGTALKSDGTAYGTAESSADINTDDGTAQEEINIASAADSGTDTVDKQEFTMTEESDTQYSISSSVDESGNTGGSSDASTAHQDSLLTGGKPAKSTYKADYLAFRDIFLSDPGLAQNVTVTDETTGTQITLTDSEDISALFEVMDHQQFIHDTEAVVEKSYTIEVTVSEENDAVYTMTVGSSIIIDYTDGLTSSHGIYKAQDSAQLLQELSDFFNGYSK